MGFGITRIAVGLAAAVALSGCNILVGEQVEIPPAHVGKIMTKDGYKDDTYTTSRFRLDRCINYCDKLVLLDVSDQPVKESMKLFMPKDKLEMEFDLQMTLSLNPDKYNNVFSLVSPNSRVEGSTIAYIGVKRVYTTYAQQIILAEAREFLSQYTIDEVSSSRESINAQLSARLSESIQAKTPFSVRYAGLANIVYPEVIMKAQINSAERRERIRQEQAQLEVSKVQLGRELQEQQLQRKIEVEKASAEAEVNLILAESVTPSYELYRKLNALDKIAESDNKVFIPADMLSSMAGQVMLGNSGRDQVLKPLRVEKLPLPDPVVTRDITSSKANK